MRKNAALHLSCLMVTLLRATRFEWSRSLSIDRGDVDESSATVAPRVADPVESIGSPEDDHPSASGQSEPEEASI